MYVQTNTGWLKKIRKNELTQNNEKYWNMGAGILLNKINKRNWACNYIYVHESNFFDQLNPHKITTHM